MSIEAGASTKPPLMVFLQTLLNASRLEKDMAAAPFVRECASVRVLLPLPFIGGAGAPHSSTLSRAVMNRVYIFMFLAREHLKHKRG